MNRTVLVTGMSGAGRTTCLKFLEDLGYEAVDNLPIGLIGRLLRTGEGPEPYDLALGVDSRTRDFAPLRLVEEVEACRLRLGTESFTLLFLDCDDEVLSRRFSTTRRRHPLADHLSVAEALRQERPLLAPVRAAADLVLDTSDLALPDLRRILAGHFAGAQDRLQIAVVSFSYKRGVPRDADLVLDLRFLKNPYYVEALRPLTGQDAPVQAYIEGDPDLAGFVARVEALIGPLLPRYEAEGKSYLTLAFGCTGGQHRSVFLSERIGDWLCSEGWAVTVVHRDLPDAIGGPAPGRNG